MKFLVIYLINKWYWNIFDGMLYWWMKNYLLVIMSTINHTCLASFRTCWSNLEVGDAVMLEWCHWWNQFHISVSPNTNEPLYFFFLNIVCSFLYFTSSYSCWEESYPRRDASYFLLTHSRHLWCPLAAKLWQMPNISFPLLFFLSRSRRVCPSSTAEWKWSTATCVRKTSSSTRADPGRSWALTSASPPPTPRKLRFVRQAGHATCSHVQQRCLIFDLNVLSGPL